MNDEQMHFALREWRQQFLAPASIVVMIGVAVVLGIMVPFGTDETLGPLSRFAYWIVTVVTTYGSGALINELLTLRLRDRVPLWLHMIISGIVTGVAITAIMTVINLATFQFLPSLSGALSYFGNIFVIASIVSAIFTFVSRNKAQTQNQPARVLDRLPFDKRGALLALSVEDHYVRIISSKGADVVLLRLRDAMQETGDIAGLQVHRSHWIALDAVTHAKRNGDGAVLTISDGTEIPVSRRYMPNIKEAGLLAR
ncbi:MAG: LytTR family DNA-binding domain-containing protein [Yoonia sp.]